MLEIFYDHRKISEQAEEHFHQYNYPFNQTFTIHEIPCRFHCKNQQLLKDLAQYFPVSWQSQAQPTFEVYWNTPQELLGHPSDKWGTLADPDCHFINLYDKEWVIQRDFMAYHPNIDSVFVVADDCIDDGFHNFLRYFLPRELFKKRKILFHSSCVLDEDTLQAYVFFGPSGAGKTTISQLCKDGCVLGDDMNILTFEKRSTWVEPSVLGQQYYSPQYFDHKFQVAGAFWLTQADKLKAQRMNVGKTSKLFSSFNGLFWETLSKNELQLTFVLMEELLKSMPLFELEFNKTKDVWDYVKEFKENI